VVRTASRSPGRGDALAAATADEDDPLPPIIDRTALVLPKLLEELAEAVSVATVESGRRFLRWSQVDTDEDFAPREPRGTIERMATARHILEEALKLSDEEREELLESLWASFGGELDPATEQEIQRRITEVDAGRMQTVSGDEVMDRLRQRFRGP